MRQPHRFGVMAFIVWGVVNGTSSPAMAREPGTTLSSSLAMGNPRRSPVVEVIERVRGAVVNIHSERTVHSSPEEAFTHGSNRVNGMGTGIIIDPRGYIITNHHVIEDVQVLRIRLADGTVYPAKIVARDPETDLALLKIEATAPLQTMTLGTAGDLMIGESVIAIGNAFGYEHTVTTGVVSATKRDVTLNKEISYKQLIQTDASINPGNSGGPLINIYGELVGVNVAIRAGAQGIGFAIPVDQMIRVAADMISGKKRFQALHTLTFQDRVEPGSSPAVRSLVVEQTETVTLTSAAGLQRGDVVVKADDQKITNSLDFERAILGHKAGDKVMLTILREGSERPVELVLSSGADRSSPAEMVWRKLGVRLASANPDSVREVNNQFRGGLTVTDISADGPAGKSGIQRGDILIGLHQWETLTLDNVLFVLNHPDNANVGPIKYFVIHDGKVRNGTLRQ